ncbi:MAG: DeoR/GlpR transcriptional regulator [Paenibacillus sp.]|uniref:Transcriptional regulator, DeoR family n=1 Tax=Paenibacillus aquistagni TaxID=1852522 RepID=A0A1X7L7B5_9BACL|nr:DeoR/GlpR family DNA-binding transcription regulator [Paenibacillus aquistagni]MBR2568627.1 DeoR/GlpR transcriptional regulator [Paenibacillus sp.]NMM54935.1 DeoR/GlpR transcriptional regulator [Paenibacillus aquistagni]SMG49293.1 transcriptional regulator, DeoR family [Paenibacillus aquistagni]
MSLLSEERKQYILEQLDSTGKVRVVLLAEQLQVSNETIRRDLAVLEEEERLRRVYGGAVKVQYETGEPPYQQRQVLHHEAKQKIGRCAAMLIQDGNTVYMDTGTTIHELARVLKGRKRITVITNSLTVASLLRDSLAQGLFSGRIIILGGEISPDQQSVSGHLCLDMLRHFYVDKAFISVGGVSILTGISDYDMNDTVISKAAAANAKEVIVLADYSKMGIQAFCHITPLDQVDVVVCDQPYPPSWGQELELKGITWIVAADT